MNPGQQPAPTAPPNAGQPQPQPAPVGGYGAPQPGYGNGQPAPGGYAGPGAGQPQGMPAGGPPAFSFSPPNLNESGPELPYGDHILECTGPREFVGQNSNTVILPFKVVQTNNAQAQDAAGAWKRFLTGSHRANNQMVTDAIARLVVPLSGRHKDKCSPAEALALVNEFWHQGTLDGQPVIGRRVGASCSPENKPDRNGKIHTKSIFHTL